MRKKPKLGIIGVGMVGKEAMRYFSENGWVRGKNLLLYDADPVKHFSDDVSVADIVFLCLPTPPKKDGACDISIIESAIKKYRNSKKIFVIKSTVEPGTAERLQKKYKTKVFFNPEFLTEARAREDFVKPDRQIVGYSSGGEKIAGEILKILPVAEKFFSPANFKKGKSEAINSSEAELGKYGANVFGAIKVSYANILADFAKALEIASAQDGHAFPVRYENIRKIISEDKRIGHAWMDIAHGDYRGFGGYCFPKDFKAFVSFGEKLIKKINKKEDESFRLLLAKAVGALKSIWAYNEALLKNQGLTVRAVSSHDIALQKFLKANKDQIKNA